MSQYYETATLEAQEALEDPLLRVEYNERSNQYEVLKWVPKGCDGGYYAFQMAFDQWDGRAIEALRKGRPDRWTPEQVQAHMRENKYQADKKMALAKDDFKTQFRKMIVRLAKEPKYFYLKEGVQK